jgi:signal transduction histidine kinase/ligand-binding sensor domain-containing protein
MSEATGTVHMKNVLSKIRGDDCTRAVLAAERGITDPRTFCTEQLLTSFMRFIFLAFLFALHLHGSAAQVPPLLSDYTHTAWGATEGAPVGALKITQSTDGWLWITSEKGLYRYDGVRFERMDVVHGHRLVSSDVLGLMAAKDGSLWVGYHLGGLSVFRQHGSRDFDRGDGLVDGNLLDIQEAPDSSVWVATREGAMRLARGAERFELQGANVGLPAQAVFRILFARDGTQWIASTQGVFSRRPGKARFSLVWAKAKVRGLEQGPDGTIWALGAADRHYRVPQTAAAATQSGKPELTALRMGFDRAGYTWVLTRSAVERKPDALAPDLPAQRLTLAGGLSGNFPQPFFEDREGNIWIGTSLGLDRFRRNRIAPMPVSDDLIFPGMLASPTGGIWVSNYEGAIRRLGAAGTNELVLKDRFTASHRALDGTIWLGNDKGLKRLAPDGAITIVPLPAGQLGHDPQALQQDASGALWLSMSGGGGLFRRVDDRWVKNGGVAGLPGGVTFSMALDAEGSVWMGHERNAISLIARGADKEQLRRLDASSGLDLGSVLCLYRDGRFMWVGGERGTMLYRNGRFIALRGEGGESFRGVSGIARLANGDLWLHGVDGIYRIRAASLAGWMDVSGRPVEFMRFDALDGLRGHAPQLRPLPSLVPAADGTLWFSTGSAIAMINPANVYRNVLAPPVVIRTVESNDKVHEIEERTMLDLPQGTDRLRISFTALSLAIPERVRFRYRLEGVDHGWQEALERRTVSYTNLHPGSYRFEVTASNEDGIWRRDPVVLEIHILPTFAQTKWFTLIVLLGVALLLYAGYALRVRYLSKRMQERHRVQLDERTRIARSLHDTLLQSVQGVLLSFDAHLRQLSGDARERTRLERTLDQGWRLVDEGRQQIMKLRTSAAPDELALALDAYGRDLSAHAGHSFDIRTIGSSRLLKPDVHDELYAIAREALSNASRYADAKHVMLELEYGRDAFTLRIRDDGCGLDPVVAQAGYRPGHWGLQGMRERSESIDASFHLTTEPGHGTEIVVSLPDKLAYWSPGRLLP